MLPLLTLTTFVAAFLLFLVQPMVAKMALPALGGSPAVWNTAMVVFQSLLLAGYAWAHWLARWPGSLRRWAVVAQCGLVLGAVLALPAGLPGWAPPREQSPALWLVGALLVGVGAPFVALASVSPTLQRWLARTEHPSGRDPYFLYAASNAGSLLALVGYPLLIEPLLELGAQSVVFSGLYLAAVTGVVVCAVVTWRSSRSAGGVADAPDASPDAGAPEPAPPPHIAPVADAGRAPPLLPRASPWWWLFLSFTPSALMLGVTLHVSTDLAAVPLLWVAPLALYLLTFIIAFSRWPLRVASRGAGLLGLGVALTFLLRATEPVAVIVALHLGFLFFGALVCHQRLAHLRPAPERLTGFYLVIASGGALGGVFASLVAPLVFDSVAEYPIAIVLALLAREGLRRNGAGRAGFGRRRPGDEAADAGRSDNSAGAGEADEGKAQPSRNQRKSAEFAERAQRSTAAIKTERRGRRGRRGSAEFAESDGDWVRAGAEPEGLTFNSRGQRPRKEGCSNEPTPKGSPWLGLQGRRIRRASRNFPRIAMQRAAGSGFGLRRAPNKPEPPALLVDTGFAIALLILAGAGARLGGPAWVGLAVGAGLPGVLLYLAIGSPRRFALGAAALLAAQMLLPEPDSRTVLVQRTFFGVHRVLVGPDPYREGGLLVRLRHGTTPHGMQRVDAAGEPDPTPLLYYHPRGPLGQLFGELSARADGRAQRVGLIGLGVGAAAAYAPEGARWTFYEIDAEVVRIARDSGWFSHVGEGWRWTDEGRRDPLDAQGQPRGREGDGGAADAASLEFIIGDGRLEIARAGDGEFGLIILDAFSSDAIPTHLLTREAFESYRSKLAPGGLIVLHISNRRLDLAPVIAGAARDLHMAAMIQDDVLDDPADGKWASTWVVLADAPEALDLLRGRALWRPLPADGARAWTDEYADILRALRWW